MAHTMHQPPRFDVTEEQSRLPHVLAGQIQEIAEYLEKLRVQIGRELPEFRTGSATFNPSNLLDGTGETTTVTVSGAVLGDVAFAAFSLDLQGLTVTPYVSSANTVSVRFQNETGGAVDLASGTLTAWTLQPPSHG